jgi:gamma-butyrobetaine dioxygenase
MNMMTLDRVMLKSTGLDIVLPSGKSAYFNYFWLRDNCPTSFDPVTRERSFDVFSLDQAPVPKSAVINDDTLELIWAADDHVTRHTLEFLVDHSVPARRADPAELPRKAWFADHYPSIARASQPTLKADPTAVAEFARALLVDGVGIIGDMPATEQGLAETAPLFGYIRASFFGDFFDVKTHINPTNLAFTASALEFHTDLPAEDIAPGIQYLHCIANSVEGGDNLFLDGVAVANDFRVQYPDEFKLLTETEIPFFCEHDNFDMRARQHVIELDPNGDVSGVTISGHMEDIFDHSQEFLDSYYPAYCRFGRMMHSEKYVMRFRLKAGECIVFDNHRIVHGRDSYTASSGDRHLKGCYTDRGEMRSTFRALTTKGRFQ